MFAYSHSSSPSPPTAAGAPAGHPAVEAWSRFSGAVPDPVNVHPLKQKRSAGVYRLGGVGPGRSDVIAKHAVRRKVQAEHAVYRLMLPQLSISSLRCFGLVEDPDGETAWLFIEAAEGAHYSPSRREHCVQAGKWLAALHTSASRIAHPTEVPTKALEHYHQRLFCAADRIERSLNFPASGSNEWRALRAMLADLRHLQARWQEVQGLCDGVPLTLVHGDFAPKNMLTRDSPAGVELLVFDWGTAGWGPPAADLAQASHPDGYWANADLRSYADGVQELWPHLTLPRLRALATLGLLLRSVVTIDGDASALSPQWVDKPMQKLAVYQLQLRQGLEDLGFTRCTPSSPSAPAHLDHPAWAAWRRITPAVPAGNRRLIVLQEKRNTGVYLLPGAGPARSDVVAKRSTRHEAALESWIYQQGLPGLGMHSIQCHGCVDDAEGQAWLFLQCIHGQAYAAAQPMHRRLAARWLAGLHVKAAEYAAESAMPQRTIPVPPRGLAYYHRRLHMASEQMDRCILKQNLRAEARESLLSLIEHCDLVARSWRRIERCFAPIPATLVHGDFLAKNMRIACDTNGEHLLVFDWEHAAWGSPLMDLAQSNNPADCWAAPDLSTYHKAVQAAWPGVTLATLHEGASVARILHLLVWISADAHNLGSDWLDRPLARLAHCHANLVAVLQELNWKD